MVVTEHAPGTFCWVDLNTTDAAAAKAFYGALFGWEATDIPVGEGMVYTMLKVGDNTAGALYQDTQSGIPPHWNSYVSVTSVDETVAKAKDLGGAILMEPHDVFDAGRMAVIRDPQGATISTWQPRAHIGANLVDEPGALCWNELYTRDTKASAAFYTGLFGWDTKGLEFDYTEFLTPSRPAGGMMAITESMGDCPPHWLPYFQVADCDAGVKQAESLGAKVWVPGKDVPGVGRFAILSDPQGAGFAIIKLTTGS